MKLQPNKTENYNKAIELADNITSSLPPETQAKINKVRKNLPDRLVKGVEKATEQEIKETQEASGSGTTTDEIKPKKDNTMLYVGLGGAALVAGYLITKKKIK